MSGTQALAETLAAAHPDETAQMLENFTAARSAEFLSSLDADAAAGVVQEISRPQATAILNEMTAGAAAGIMNRTPVNEAAGLLRSIPAARRDEILGRMHRTRQVQVGLVLRQPSMSVGAWMDSAAAPSRTSSPVGDVKKRLVETPVSYSRVYVIDDTLAYAGSVPVSAVLAADDNVPLERIYEPGGPRLRAGTEIAQAISDSGWQSHDQLPVVDRTGKFVGAIRYSILRSALTKLEKQPLEAARPPGASLMDFADIWYVGMARVMDTFIGRKEHPDGTGTGRDRGEKL
jgi:Mg/Co/Ni transporter MgtE